MAIFFLWAYAMHEWRRVRRCKMKARDEVEDALLEIAFIASLVPLLPYIVIHRAALDLADF